MSLIRVIALSILLGSAGIVTVWYAWGLIANIVRNMCAKKIKIGQSLIKLFRKQKHGVLILTI